MDRRNTVQSEQAASATGNYNIEDNRADMQRKHNRRHKCDNSQQLTALQLPEQDGTTQQVNRDPLFRHTTKKPVPTTTAIPHPSTMTPARDYWIREGHYWKRVHVQVRTTMYVPQQTDVGPDIGRLKATRTTFVNRTEQGRGYTTNDNWHESGARPLDRQWTGSTNFEEEVQYKYEYDTDNEDEPQQAQRAKGMKAPQQPTRQERLEHELTHLPYRSWCPICVKSKGRTDNHPRQASKQPVTQVDFTLPIFAILRILLTMAQRNHWTIQAGDVSTAFLHAPAATDNLYMWPPPELYPSGHNTTTVWKLNKAIYGLRSSLKSWQDHFAQVLQQMGLSRLTSEPNVYRNNEQTMFVTVYVDDLLFLGQQQEVDKTFNLVQKHVLLRPTGTLGIGQTI